MASDDTRVAGSGKAVSIDPPLVSIIIVNFNGARFLPACLDSVGRLAYTKREVVLVDNGSTDESITVAQSYPWVKLVRSDRNLGFAGGNNLGLSVCSGELVLLLNNDTIVTPDFLEPLCGYLSKHQGVGIVQGKMVLPNFGGGLDVCGSFLTPLGVPYHYGIYKPDGPQYERSYAVFSGKGACLMFRRQIIPDVGGFLFDEDFFCYYEESDFCHRAWLAGWETHFVNTPPIQHLMGGTAGGPHAAFVLKHYLRNMAFSLLSNLSFPARLRILPLFFCLLVLGWVASALSLNRGKFSAHWGAVTCYVASYGRIRARRKLIRNIRKRSDSSILKVVMRRPRIEYFVKTFTGRLREYVDEDLE
ncbi:MAG TPA: glycosyltransferase family 2 protein [Verrucomicrobiae bacterium]|nr:glycosyltransferase family 2 protein [Verrucomicrobiae bacterium]